MQSISKRILINILLLSTLVTMVLIGISLYFDYQADRRFVLNHLSNTEHSILPGIARALWVFDEISLKNIIDPVVDAESIRYAEVRTADQQSVLHATGNKPATPPDRIAPVIYHSANDDEQKIGYLQLYADFDVVNRSLKDRFLRTAISQIIKTFIVAAFTLFVVHYLVSRHLIVLSKQLNSKDSTQPGQPPLPLIIDRKPANDELQLLIDTMSNYRTDLYHYHNELEHKNHELNEQLSLNLKISAQEIEKNRSIKLFLDTVKTSVFWLDKSFRLTRYNRQAGTYFATHHNIIGQPATQLINISLEENNLPDSNKLNTLLLTRQQTLFKGFCQIEGEAGFPAYITAIPLYQHHELNGYALIIENKLDQQRIEAIQYSATHDHLTGLYNRYQMDKIIRELKASAHTDDEYTVGFLDLDRFKIINDLFGHLFGDKVLRKTAEILHQILGDKAYIARQGGDEFIFVIKHSKATALQLAQQVVSTLKNTSLNKDGQTLSITASIGLGKLDFSRENINTSLAKVDKACYQVKETGGNGVNYLDILTPNDSPQQKIQEYNLLNLAQKKISRGEFALYAQELIPLQNTTTLPKRQEILLRLLGEDETISPGSFIPMMERLRLMPDIDKQILLHLNDMLKKCTASMHLNVNLSPISIYSDKARQAVISILQTARKSGSQICFEITEDTITRYDPQVKAFIDFIHANDGLIAIDDFGKGHASYAHFHAIDVDIIKIDGELIRTIDTDRKLRAIVASIQSIANSIGAMTVAEHVSNTKQRQLLRDIGIDYEQSHLNSPPALFKID